MAKMKSAKCCLVSTCFIALGVILCRFVVLYQETLTSKLRIYSFIVAGRELKIGQDGSNAEKIQWSVTGATKLSTSQPDKAGDYKSRADKRESVVTAVPTANVLKLPTLKQRSSKPTVPRTVAGATKPSTSQTQPDKAGDHINSRTNKRQSVVTAAPTANVVDLPTFKQRSSKPTIPRASNPNELTIKTTPVSETKMVNSTFTDGLCPKTGEKLVGALAVDQSVPQTESDIDNVWDEKGWVEKGGAWRPTKCKAISKVAIIIPYRKRKQHLKIFLRHMHPMLKRQLLDYRILVIEQAGKTPFNRAMLFNIGYKESLKLHDFQCFVFHDVDLIPEDDRNYYGCPTAPRHLSAAIDKFQYRLPYNGLFGGAGSFKKADFEIINGFSNKFWGWGGEDDDLYKRITAKKLKLSRPSMTIGRYKMIRAFHKSAGADPERFAKLRDSQQRMVRDGLSSLKYNVQKVDERPLYTLVTVEVDPRQV